MCHYVPAAASCNCRTPMQFSELLFANPQPTHTFFEILLAILDRPRQFWHHVCVCDSEAIPLKQSRCRARGCGQEDWAPVHPRQQLTCGRGDSGTPAQHGPISKGNGKNHEVMPGWGQKQHTNAQLLSTSF